MGRIVELKNVFDECVNYMSSYGSIKPPCHSTVHRLSRAGLCKVCGIGSGVWTLREVLIPIAPSVDLIAQKKVSL